MLILMAMNLRDLSDKARESQNRAIRWLNQSPFREQSQPLMLRAQRSLSSNQQDHGSWLVHTRNPNSHDVIISFYGTGWATLGLIRSLAPAVAASR